MAAIGIVLGSYSDLKRMQSGLDRLESFQVPFEICIASAHRAPEGLARWLAGCEERGVRVIVAGAGAAAHLPGAVAAQTLLPVIGVPFDASPLGGRDALYSIVQMPPGIPVATVGIDSAENAVLLALHILATGDAGVREQLRAFRAGWQARIEEQNAQLHAEYPRARPVVSPAARADAPAPGREAAAPRRPAAAASSADAQRIRKVDAENPSLAVIEEAVDVLLDGGIVALPTDTVYGLAADATNPEAVARLQALKGRDPRKPIAILIDSEKLFHTLVVEVPEGVEDLIERYWPGPLTIVARKRRAALQAVSGDESLGLRMPDHLMALGLINMLARPLATTSANRAGEAPFREAREIARCFGEQVDLVLDAGPLPDNSGSTVISVLDKPYRLLREGPIGREALAEVLGDLLG